jgi:hypothetical protein
LAQALEVLAPFGIADMTTLAILEVHFAAAGCHHVIASQAD